jgi:hypothetical protein
MVAHRTWNTSLKKSKPWPSFGKKSNEIPKQLLDPAVSATPRTSGSSSGPPSRNLPLSGVGLEMNEQIREQLLALAYEQQDDVYGSSQRREFDCLIALIEDGTINTFEELAKYGIEQ